MTTAIDRANRVHEFLLSRDVYPEHPQNLEVRETHISWVYLTDRFVYKQKKPVTFEFLDFSTLEQRRHFCQQEVALNRRFSPEVYLGVVPVSCDSSGKFRMKPGREVVEWLVKMVRLDERSTLQNLILGDQLTASHVAALSKRLAGFFASQAPKMLRSDQFLRDQRQHVLANRNDLMVAAPDAESLIDFATNSQLRCLSLNLDYFVQRVCDGRIVDGHGDLRPEHIYFRGLNPAIIDCIEFNAEYRTNDVVDELAFLAMECDRIGNRLIGQVLLDDYLKLSGDDPKPFLLDFYKCYRACVRAKVAALRTAQLQTTEQAESSDNVRSYLHLAHRYAAQLGKPLIIMVGGLMGSGKSTLAATLQECLAAELLQTDAIRNELFERNGDSKFGNGKYSAASRQLVYDQMISRIGERLQRSPTVILDATFSDTVTRESVETMARKLDAQLIQVQCRCSATEAMDRIARRLAQGDDASEARPELYARQAERYGPLLANVEVIDVDTQHNGANQLEEILSRIRDRVSVGTVG